MSPDLLNVLLICSLAYGVLQVPLLFAGKEMSPATIPVILLIITMLWIQVEFLVVRNLWNVPQGIFFGTRYGSWLFMGPALYYAVYSSLYHEYPGKKLLVEMLPGMVTVFILPIFAEEAIPRRAVDYGMLTILTYGKLGYTPWQGFYGFIFIAQFIHLAFYLLRTFRTLKQAGHEMKKVVSRIIPLHWLRIILVLMTIILGGSGFFFYSLLTSYQYYRYWDFFYALPFSLATYIIVFMINRYPQSFRNDLKLVRNRKYEKSGLGEDLLQGYAERLKKAVREERLYLDHALTLKKLADKINVNPHHLSQVFNRSLRTTFFDYINLQRVEEAQRLLKSNNQSILEVAMNSGFATKASFNKYFKTITGMTPTEFLKGVSD